MGQVRMKSCVHLGERTEDTDGKPWIHDAYSVELICDGRTIVVPWRQGVGFRKKSPINPYKGTPVPPKVEAVLSSLLSDARAGSLTFEDFCGEFGYDTDSREAMATYLECQEMATKVRRLLGRPLPEYPEFEDDEKAAEALCALRD